MTAPRHDATADQADTIARLEAVGWRYNVTVDAEAVDTVATGPCDNDWAHGYGTVATPHGYLCPTCAEGWVWWHSGDTVSPEVMRLPHQDVTAVAA